MNIITETQTIVEPKIELYNMDCMEYMKQCKDNEFDLAIVDPPYGIGAEQGYGQSNNKKIHNRLKSWDSAVPNKEYFKELFRVSKNQIIWGGNYFDLPPTRCFIVWDKQQQGKNFSDCELAWTSFDKIAKIYTLRYLAPYECNIYNTVKRIHPSQKRFELYEWLLKNYAETGNKILDTHLGSGSSAIAAYNYKFDFVGLEIDKEYFDAALKRFNNHKSQLTMF
jgi:site-specific DNA-methyltransferase (adenine-specific)